MNPDDIASLDGPSVAPIAKRGYVGPKKVKRIPRAKIKLKPKPPIGPRGRRGY